MNRSDPLRVTVVGAGIVGCTLGGALARQADVTLLGRPDFLDPIAESGLTIETRNDDPLHVRAEALTLSTSPTAVRDADVVLVCTKSGSTASVTSAILPHLPDDAVIIGMQNGLHAADAIRDGVSHHLVLAGMVPYNIVRTGPSSFLQASAGTVMINRHRRVTDFVATARAAGLSLATTTDMQAVLHGKLLMNLNNAVQALSGLPLRSELLDRDLRRCVAACQTEAVRVFAAAGVIPRVPLPVPARSLPWVMRLPTPIFRLAAQATLQVDPRGGSSTADDLLRGRPTEIDDLQGEVVQMGERLDIPTPVNRRVVELVKDAETAGPGYERWTGRGLRSALRSAARVGT